MDKKSNHCLKTLRNCGVGSIIEAKVEKKQKTY